MSDSEGVGSRSAEVSVLTVLKRLPGLASVDEVRASSSGERTIKLEATAMLRYVPQ